VRLFGSKADKVALLRGVPLFEGLSQNQLRQIAQLADETEVPAGKRLATAGEYGHEFFVIIDGEATVKIPAGRKLRLGRGDWFGEMSLLDGGPRSASVEAASPLRLLVIGHREFWQFLSVASQINRKIMETLSRRLRQAEEHPCA
jgi:CRP-like cAMP-binding protein